MMRGQLSTCRGSSQLIYETWLRKLYIAHIPYHQREIFRLGPSARHMTEDIPDHDNPLVSSSRRKNEYTFAIQSFSVATRHIDNFPILRPQHAEWRDVSRHTS